MTQVHIKSVKLSASGKAYNVQTDSGKFYVAGLATGIEQAEGKTVDAELGSFRSANGKTIETIDGFTLTDSPKQPVASSSGSNGHSDRWYMPFISNTVAHAIQCGLIKGPGDIGQWARAAYRVALTLDAFQGADDVPSEALI